MNVFYSIVYVSIKPIANEQLSVGLFLSNGSDVFFHYSPEKLNLIHKLLSDDAFDLVKHYIEGFNQDINSEKRNFKHSHADYFSYLSDYNNNLITFSKPTQVSLKADKMVFQTLFEKFVFKFKAEVKNYVTKESPLTVVKEGLYPLIRERVNINKTLTTKEIPNLLVSKVKVNFIGQNNKPVVGDVIDFESGTNAIDNKIGHFTTLIDALNKKPGKYYIIGEEPSKKLFPEQHATWVQVHNSKSLEFVPLNEVEKISEYMKRHNVKPFVAVD